MVPTETMTPDKDYQSGDISSAGNISTTPSPDISILDQVTLGLAWWVTPITVTFGLLGNLLTFLVMTRKKNRRISCCVYMTVLSITDSYTLISYMGFNACAFKPTGICLSLPACKMAGYLMGTTNVAGTMLLVALTVDRFIAVRFPLKSRLYCTPRRARIFTAIVLTFCIIYDVPHIFFSGFFKGPMGPACLLLINGGRIYSGMNIIVVVILPFLVLLVLNIMIIRVIRDRTRASAIDEDQPPVVLRGKTEEQRRKSSVAAATALRTHTGARRGVGGSSGDILEEINRKKERDKQLTRMLLFVTLAYIILTAPQYTRQTLALFVNFSNTPQSHSIYTLVTCIFQRFYYFNFAINFYLYFFTGSKFRMDLFRMLCCVNESRSPDMTDSQVHNTNQVLRNSPVADRHLSTSSRYLNMTTASTLNLAQSTQNLRTEFVRQMSRDNGVNTWQNFKSFFQVVRVMRTKPGASSGSGEGYANNPPTVDSLRTPSAAAMSPRIEPNANPIDVLLESQRRRSRCMLDVPMPPTAAFNSVSRLTTISDVIQEAVMDGQDVVTSHHVINIIRSTSQEIGPAGEAAGGLSRSASVRNVQESSLRTTISRSSRSSTRSVKTTEVLKRDVLSQTSRQASITSSFTNIPDITAPELDSVFHTGVSWWPQVPAPILPALDVPSSGRGLGVSMDTLLTDAITSSSLQSTELMGAALRRCASAHDVGRWANIGHLKEDNV